MEYFLLLQLRPSTGAAAFPPTAGRGSNPRAWPRSTASSVRWSGSPPWSTSPKPQSRTRTGRTRTRVRFWSRARWVRTSPAPRSRPAPPRRATALGARRRSAGSAATLRLCSGSWSTTTWTWTRFWTYRTSSPASRCPPCRVAGGLRRGAAPGEEPWRGTEEEEEGWRAPLWPTTSLWAWAAAAARPRWVQTPGSDPAWFWRLTIQFLGFFLEKKNRFFFCFF